MEPEDRKLGLEKFLNYLPDHVEVTLLEQNIYPIDVLNRISDKYELILEELWWLYEGVRRVFNGEDTPDKFPDFIKPYLEEHDWRSNYDIVKDVWEQVFIPVLPMLKDSQFPVTLAGALPPPLPQAFGTSQITGVASPYAPVESPLSYSSFPKGGAGGGGFQNPSANRNSPLPLGKGESVRPPLDEKNVRALVRIAAGTKYTEGDLRSAFEGLPTGLRQAVSSVDTANAIQDIAKKYLLHVDQMAALASETGLVLLGLTHPAEFIGNLGNRLRLPEERAREVARDISMQILTKVREALRGLHESPLEKGVPESARGRVVTTPASEAGGTPFAKGDGPPLAKMNIMPTGLNSSFAKEGAGVGGGGGFQNPSANQNSPLPLGKASSRRLGELPRANTPYSAGAKWNTGDNVLSRQSEPLSRAEVLKGIENPQSVAPRPVAPTLPERKPINSQLRTPVGPTGWKPAAAPVPEQSSLRGAADGGKNQTVSSLNAPQSTPFPKYPINKLETVAPPEKSRPTDTSGPPTPSKPQPEPQDFLDQKLETPMALPKEEKRYTSDPYREPLS